MLLPQEMRPQLRTQYPDDDSKVIRKRLGELWKEVTEEEKQVRGSIVAYPLADLSLIIHRGFVRSLSCLVCLCGCFHGWFLDCPI